MIPRSFYFLRHGETDWNAKELIQGCADIPLNETGRAQARDAIAVLQKYPIDRIISSPLLRASETAEIIHAVLQKNLEKHDDLRERHFGIFEGKTKTEYEEYRRINPSDKHFIPEAEEYKIFNDRIVGIIAEALNKYEGENILFVGHGGVYRALSRHFFGDADHAKNSWPYHFILENGVWTLKELT